jgi:SAM-dependent methyltransferase
LEELSGCGEVLDVGCWAGYAGRHLLDLGVGAVDGVEPHLEMADRARGSGYRQVFGDRIERRMEEIEPHSYDGVVLFDVIEHLEDPWAALAAAGRWLRPGGRIALSVPNVAFWSVRKELFFGRFQYAQSGILDRTHLRFFTLRTLEAAVAEAGLVTALRTATGAPLPLVGFPGLGARAARSWPSLFSVQFVWLCSAGER